jgi:hypothetical protein
VKGRIAEATYLQQVLAKTHWPLSVATLDALLREIIRQPMPGMPDQERIKYGEQAVW